MGAVAVGVGEQAPETERPAAAAPMQVHLTRSVGLIDEDRLLRRDVLILQVEAARLRRRVRRPAGGLSRAG
jgi:hypothetical protein